MGVDLDRSNREAPIRNSELYATVLGALKTLDVEARVLNMAPADLATQLQTKTRAEIARAQRVDLSIMKQALLDFARDSIRREVQEGILAEAQADEILAALTPDRINLAGRPSWPA